MADSATTSLAKSSDDFQDWLCTKLANTDQEVFVTYIRGILEGDETRDDKLEGLEGILVEIMSDNTCGLSQEILDRWDKMSLGQNNGAASAECSVDVNAKLASIMEKQAQCVVSERKVTAEQRQYKEAILAQYSHVSDGEDDSEEEERPEVVEASPPVVASAGSSLSTPSSTPSSAFVVTKNTNAEDVARAEREKRDKAKGETEKKKAADKANKEKQKQAQQERKEKEKKRTQKGERKR